MLSKKLFDFKHFDIIRNEIGLLDTAYTHFFTEGRWSSHELLLYILSITGRADVTITSYSLSEITIRSFFKAIEYDYISSINLLVNHSVKRDKLNLLLFANKVVTKIGLLNLHMKITLIKNENYSIVINQSSNSTVNNSHESGVIFTSESDFNLYYKQLEDNFKQAIIINESRFDC